MKPVGQQNQFAVSNPPQNSEFYGAGGEAVGALAANFTLGAALGPFSMIFRGFGKSLVNKFFDARGTDGARAAGMEHLDPKASLEELDRVFIEKLDRWIESAERIDDPKKRSAAIERLRQIKAAWAMGIKSLESAKEKPELHEYAFFKLFGSAGDTLEKGSMGDVFALILSGDVSTMDQLMGKDGLFGIGDGLDGKEWVEIQDAYMEDLNELKQTFELKPKEHGDVLFDELQEKTLKQAVKA